MLWLRSYWDPERHLSRCIFAARTSAAVREAVMLSPVGIDRLTRVSTVHPSMWAEIYDRLGLPRHWESPQSGETPGFPPL